MDDLELIEFLESGEGLFLGILAGATLIITALTLAAARSQRKPGDKTRRARPRLYMGDQQDNGRL